MALWWLVRALLLTGLGGVIGGGAAQGLAILAVDLAQGEARGAEMVLVGLAALVGAALGMLTGLVLGLSGRPVRR